MTKPHSPCSVDNRYDGPLLTDTPQYIFITRAVKKFLSGSLIMNSRRLWNLHQGHKFLRTEASRDILELESQKRHFQGSSRGIFPPRMLCCFVRIHARLGTMLSKCPRCFTTWHSTVRTFHRTKPVQIYVQCHSSSLFDGTYFLLAVMVEGDESSQLRMAN